MGVFRGIELDDLTLATERLVLRPWHPTDAARVAEIMAEPAMHAFLALPSPYTQAAAREYVAGIAVRPRAEGTGLECAVVERASGRLVGSAALRLGTHPNVGYWVATEAQGRGFATEATRALAEWAFGCGVPRVRLECEVGNVVSARVALAAGFSFEGVSRDEFFGGGFADVAERRGDLARFARLAGDGGDRVPPAFPPLADDELADGVLRLRPVRAADAAALIECEDELTTRWGFDGFPRPPAQITAAARRAGLDWLVGGRAHLAMVDAATGQVAGSIGLRKAGPPQVGGIGYVVHPTFRGRGYTSRALRLLAPWAFDVADFARLELGAKIGNVASSRAAASAGWTPEGIRRTRLRNGDGTFGDEQRFVLLNPKYV